MGNKVLWLLLLLLDPRCHLVPLSSSVAMRVGVSLTNHASVFISGEIPPYHYGTHYSSTMIVASYLIRLEPFTQHFLRVQVIAMCLLCLHSATLVAVVYIKTGTFVTPPPHPLTPLPLLRGENVTEKKETVF